MKYDAVYFRNRRSIRKYAPTAGSNMLELKTIHTVNMQCNIQLRFKTETDLIM